MALTASDIKVARDLLAENKAHLYQGEDSAQLGRESIVRYWSGIPEPLHDICLEYLNRFVSAKNQNVMTVVASGSHDLGGKYYDTGTAQNGDAIYSRMDGIFGFRSVPHEDGFCWDLYRIIDDAVIFKSAGQAGRAPELSSTTWTAQETQYQGDVDSVWDVTWSFDSAGVIEPVSGEVTSDLFLQDRGIMYRSVVDPMVNGGKSRQGVWRASASYVRQDPDGRYKSKGAWAIVQTLSLGMHTEAATTESKTEWLLKDGKDAKSGSRNIALELRYCDPSLVRDMADGLNAPGNVFNSSIWTTNGGLLEGKWYHVLAEWGVNEDDGFGWIRWFLRNHDNEDFRFFYRPSDSETVVDFFKLNVPHDGIDDFHNHYYFTPSGDFYVSTDGTAYTARNGEAAEGELPPDAKLLSDAADGRFVQRFDPASDEQTGTVDLRVRLVFYSGAVDFSRLSAAGDERIVVANAKRRMTIREIGSGVSRDQLESIRALYDVEPAAGTFQKLDFSRRPNGTYDFVGVVVSFAGYVDSYTLGDLVYHVGHHVALKPSTEPGADESVFTRIEVEGTVLQSSASYNEEDGSWSWRIIEQAASSYDGGTDADSISGSAPIIKYGEPLEQERFVKRVTGQSLAELKATINVVGRYENVKIIGDEIVESIIPAVLVISGIDTAAVDWELYPEQDANGYPQWTVGGDFALGHIYRDPTRGFKFNMEYGGNTWYSTSTITSADTPPSGVWYLSTSDYETVGDVTISGTGTDADGAWEFHSYDSAGYPTWALASDPVNSRLYRDPARSYRWTLKLNSGVRWYCSTENDDFYPPSTGWASYPGTGYNSIFVEYVEDGEDPTGENLEEWEYYGIQDIPGDTSGALAPTWKSPYMAGPRIWSAEMESGKIWYHLLNDQTGDQWYHNNGGAGFDAADMLGMYPPVSGWEYSDQSDPEPPDAPFLSYQADPIYQAANAPTVAVPAGDPPVGAGEMAFIESITEGGTTERSGRRLVSTRVRNPEIRDGKISYDLVEMVYTAPINTDDGWFWSGWNVQTEPDEQRIKTICKTTTVPADITTADHETHIYSVPRMRKVTSKVYRKYFIRKPTDSDLEMAGVPMEQPTTGDEAYDELTNVRYALGQSGRLHYVDKMVETLGNWVPDTSAKHALDFTATPIYHKYIESGASGSAGQNI